MVAIPNIVVFGETGAGKSSLINLIAGKDTAPISCRSAGCTLRSECYPVDFDGMRFNLHDTAGLDEGQGGSVAKQDAIVQLYTLLRKLETGVSLLVFCMRGPRIKESFVKNWRLFWEIICQGRVPLVLVVTGLEHEDPMDNWWTQNEKSFTKYEMYPDGVVCGTATRGRQRTSGYTFEEEYRETQVKVRVSIRMAHLRNPWRIPPAEWFKVIVETSYREKGKSVEEIKTSKTVFGSATQELVARCEMTTEEANALARSLNGI